MPKLRVLSGRELLLIFERFGFVEISQKGSHVKLRRFVNGEKQTLTIPNHKMVARPTLRDIHQQALPYVSALELRKDFFTE